MLENKLWLAILIPMIVLIVWLFKKKIHQNKARKITIVLLRICTITLLTIAIAQPFVLKENIKESTKPVYYLQDNSKSFELYKTGEEDIIFEKISHENNAVKILFGNEINTDIEEALSKAEKDSKIIILSDGNSNKGNMQEAIKSANAKNITITAIKPIQQKNEVAVWIKGAEEIYEDFEAEFTAELSGKGKEDIKKMIIEIDGKQEILELEKGKYSYSLKQKFQKGKHEIKAEIKYKDEFKENNIYYKEINIVKKPKALLINKINQESKTIKSLINEYDVSEENNIPLELNEQDIIIINDIKEFSDAEAKRLRQYAINGRGIVFLGGKNSFDYGDYEKQLIEDILPVKIGMPEKRESEQNIAIVIDISSSTASQEDGIKKVDIEKAQAINLINKLKPKNFVSAIAFNTEAFRIGDGKVERNKEKIIENISSLQFGGGTIISQGIKEAINSLKDMQGNKVIILLSDGKTQEYQKTLEEAELAKANGIRIYTIATGISDDEEKLKEIAKTTGGEYLTADKTKTLSILYNKIDENKAMPLTKEREHFITNNINISGEISGSNDVVTKNSAINIIKAGDNDIISIWNFGDGRIAVIATGEEYAWQLFSGENSNILKRTFSWALGGKQKIQENKNYPEEIKETELNEDFFRYVAENKGKVSDIKDIDSIITNSNEKSKMLVNEKQHYSSFFIATAILLFCIELWLRKFVFEME